MTPHLARARCWVGAGILGLVLGVGAWLQFAYERSPDPERVTVVAERAPVHFQLERYPGDLAPASELSGAGFVVASDGGFESKTAGGRVTYSGPVGSRLLVRFTTGPDQGRASILLDGERVDTVDLTRATPGHEVVALDLPLRVQPASFVLLAWLVTFGVALAVLAVRAVGATVRTFGPGRAFVVFGGVATVAIGLVGVSALGASRVHRAEVLVEHPGGPDAGAEIAVRLDRASGFPRYSVADHFGGPGWTLEDGWSVATRSGAAARWSGMVSLDDALELRSEREGVRVTVRVNDDTYHLRVGGPADGVTRVRFADLSDAMAPSDRVLALLSRLAGTVLAAALLVVVVGAIGRIVARWRTRGLHTRRSVYPYAGRGADWGMTVRLAALPFAGWLALLVVFWPGPMNPDAMSQWFQVEDGVLADWHPYLLALFFAATRAVVDSPWLPILLVITGASLLVGRFGAWCVARGRPVTTVALSSLLVLVVPATAMHTVTLWKDSFYGVGLLALVLCLWRIEDTRAAWLGRPRNIVLLAATGAGTWLVRHNGWPVVLGSLFVVFLAYRQCWRHFAVVVAAILLVVGAVQGPLAQLLDVGPNPVDEIVLMQHISMHLREGTELSRAERRFLESIRPLDEPWPYDCRSIQATWSGPDAIPIDDYSSLGSDLRSIALALARRNPRAELRHLACASKLVWQPWSAGTTQYFMEWYESGGRVHYLPTWLDKSPMEEPPNAGLVVAVYRAVGSFPSWLIRPALYLYTLLIAVAWAVRRTRTWAPMRMASPALLQSLTLAFVTLVQDVRFQYGVVLVALVLVPMFVTARPRASEADPALVWRDWPARSGGASLQRAGGATELLQPEAFADR